MKPAVEEVSRATPSGRPKRIAAAAIAIVGALVLWEAVVRWFHVPEFIVPGPLTIARTLVTDWAMLSKALVTTLEVTGLALVTAVVFGVLLAVVMNQVEWLEAAFFPFMIVLQVTPVIAVAPLIILWVNNTKLGLLLCAWLIAFFPIVANTLVGLKSADRGLEDLFKLYGTSRWKTFRYLRMPSAVPYFLAGLRISGGLSLVGAIAAEFVAGTGGQGSGLAFRILEAGYNMAIPRMFAALALISVTGLLIHLVLAYVSHRCLRRWHASALKKEL